MKRLFTLFYFLTLAFGIFAQTATAEFTNNSAQYFGGVFHSYSVVGCPTSSATTVYIDIPNDGQTRITQTIGVTGIISNVGDISGITLNPVYLSTNYYLISFCDGSGNIQLQGSKIISAIPSPPMPFTIVSWNINTGTNTIEIFIN